MDERLFNVTAKNIEVLGSGTGINLQSFGLGSGFLNKTLKAMKKEKGDQLDFIKIKNFCVKQCYQESENQFT